MGFYKEGDIINIFDGSYAYIIGSNGKLKSTSGLYLVNRDFEIVALNCDLPAYSYPLKKEQRNDTILRDIETNEVVFIKQELFRLKHRCSTCPNCGQNI